MKKYKKIILSMALLCGVSSSMTYASGDVKYLNPETIELTTIDFGSTDLNMIAEKMVVSMLQSQIINGTDKPIIQFANIKNKTNEQIYTNNIMDKIKVNLLKSGKIKVSVYNEIGDILQKELNYQSSKYVKKNTAKQIGNQVGAQYIMYGELTSINKKGDNNYDLYYKITLNLANIESAVLDWADEKEIRKIGSKSNLSNASTSTNSITSNTFSINTDNAHNNPDDDVKKMVDMVTNYREGMNYFIGQNGVKKDSKKAMVLFQKAALMGNTQALYALGWMYDNGDAGLVEDKAKALEYYRKAADLGDSYGIYGVAWMYDNGKGGVAEDKVKALEYYRKAATLGNVQALYAVGWMYDNGKGGVVEDKVQAFEYYKKAYDLGNIDAIYALGWMYENGKGGVAQDKIQALEYYKKAANLGNAQAFYALGYMYYNAQGGITQDKIKSLEYYKKAYDLGNVDAIYALGWMYDNGEGIAQDKIKALEYYKKAADRGNIPAKNWLKTLGVY